MKKSTIYISVIKKNKPLQKYKFSESTISKDGNFVEEKAFYKNGTVEAYIKTTRTKNNTYETLLDNSYDKNGKLTHSMEIQDRYDDKGNLLNQKIIDDGNWSEEKYVYDKNNRLIAEIMNDDDGNKYLTDIGYDENDKQNMLLFRTNNELTTSVEIIYEEDFKKKISNMYNSYDAFLERTITYFDKYDSPIKYERYDRNKDLISTSNYIYSDLGLLESADFDKNQKITQRISKSYDEENNLIKKSVIEHYSKGILIKKEISEWEYEFYDD